MKRLLGVLLLLASPVMGQLCSESFTLRTTACPAGALDCTNKGSTLTHAELDADIINIIDICKPFDVSSTAVSVQGDWTFLGSLEVPNGAALTVNADGEVSHDITADQLVYGADPTVLHPVRCETLIIENLAAADDNYPLGMKNFARTITAVGLHCAGTCTVGADISLEDRAGNAMTHTVPTHSTGSTSTTFQNVTAANTLVSGEGLRFDVDNAVDPETDTYEITVCFTIDRQ